MKILSGLKIKLPDLSKIIAPFLFYKTVFAWISRMWKFPFFYYLLSLVLALVFLTLVHFGHPVPNAVFTPVILFQFAFGFVPNFFYRRTGRIFTMAGALFLSRTSAIGAGVDFVTLGGLFTGAIVGIFVRDLMVWLIPVEAAKETDPLRRISALNRPAASTVTFLNNVNSGIIIFLLALTAERFIVYFNAPFIKGTGVLETMYLPGVSSREAFGLSIDILAGLMFPFLYILLEERTSPETNKPYIHWLMGLVAGFVMNLFLMYLQSNYSLNFFAQATNLAIEAGRPAGFFRDSGSSSWIMAVLAAFFILQILNKNGTWRNNTRYMAILLLLISGMMLGLKQGRTFYFIFLPAVAVIFTVFSLKSIRNKYARYLWISFIVLVMPVFLAFAYFKGAESKSATLQIMNLNLKGIVQGKGDLQDKLTAIDKPRYFLTRAALDFFRENVMFGNGAGSFIVHFREKDPNQVKYPVNIIDGPPSLYAGVLTDTGVLGSVVLLVWLGMVLYARRNWKHAVFLFLPFLTGYQISHPDGALLAVVLLSLSGVKLVERKWLRLGNILVIGISALVLVHSLYEVNLEPRGPAFRKQITGKYQLFAAEQNKSVNAIRYHLFRGRVIFALAGNFISIPVFLDNTTVNDKLNQKWTILNADFQELKSHTITVKKYVMNPVMIYLPPQARYLMIENLDEQGVWSWRAGEIPYCIPANRFNQVNAIF